MNSASLTRRHQKHFVGVYGQLENGRASYTPPNDLDQLSSFFKIKNLYISSIYRSCGQDRGIVRKCQHIDMIIMTIDHQ